MDAFSPLELPNKAYFRIGEVAKLLDVEPHVVRFWQKQFRQVRPERSKTGRFLYTAKTVQQLHEIKFLLYERKFTIAGAKQTLKSGGVRQLELVTVDAGEQTQPDTDNGAAAGSREVEALRRELTAAHEANTALEQRLQRADAREPGAEALKAQVAGLESQVDALRERASDADELRRQLEDFEELRGIAAEAEALRTALEQARASAEAAEGAEALRSTLEARVAHAERAQRQAEQVAKDAEERVVKLEAELEGVRSASAGNDDQVQGLVDKVAELEQSLELAPRVEELTALEERIEELELALAEASSMTGEYADAAERADAEHHRLRGLLRETYQLMAELTTPPPTSE